MLSTVLHKPHFEQKTAALDDRLVLFNGNGEAREPVYADMQRAGVVAPKPYSGEAFRRTVPIKEPKNIL